MVKIYLELAILVIIVFIFFFWSVWFRWSKERDAKKYDPNNDDGRKAEESRKKGIAKDRAGESEGGIPRDNGGGDQEPPEQSDLSRGSTPITEQELFPATDSVEPREKSIEPTRDERSVDGNSKSPKGFFGKFRRKRKG